MSVEARERPAGGRLESRQNLMPLACGSGRRLSEAMPCRGQAGRGLVAASEVPLRSFHLHLPSLLPLQNTKPESPPKILNLKSWT